MGCDGCRKVGIVYARSISIHAPVWGATFQDAVKEEEDRISIHAPVWGATRMGKRRLGMGQDFNPRTRMGCDEIERLRKEKGLKYFNPRTRMGCDLLMVYLVNTMTGISIHAPVWGAT